jgi:hypothetical protein
MNDYVEPRWVKGVRIAVPILLLFNAAIAAVNAHKQEGHWLFLISFGVAAFVAGFMSALAIVQKSRWNSRSGQ